MSVWGNILSDGEVLDDGMAVVFYAPHSYTGEDTVEISCHGGILLTQRVLESVFAAGAQPGTARRVFQTCILQWEIGAQSCGGGYHAD